MGVNTRIVRGDDNRSLYVGDEIEGADAAEQVALGHAVAIPEPAAAPAPEAGIKQAARGGTVDATAAAIAHADELGVDLIQVQGSGAEGRITKADVAAHAAAAESA